MFLSKHENPRALRGTILQLTVVPLSTRDGNGLSGKTCVAFQRHGGDVARKQYPATVDSDVSIVSNTDSIARGTKFCLAHTVV